MGRRNRGAQGVHTTDATSFEEGDRFAQMAEEAGFSLHAGVEHRLGSVTSWKGYAVTYHAQLYQKNVFH